MGTWPPENPSWFAGLAGSGGAVGGAVSAGGAAASSDTKKAVEAPKEEEKKEKTHYDIELTKFDAAKKIQLIKEVRELLKLGLKEAKDLIESAPVWIKKEVNKEEADLMCFQRLYCPLMVICENTVEVFFSCILHFTTLYRYSIPLKRLL